MIYARRSVHGFATVFGVDKRGGSVPLFLEEAHGKKMGFVRLEDGAWRERRERERAYKRAEKDHC